MKKLLIVLMSCIMLLTLIAGCASKDKKKEESKDAEKVTEADDDAEADTKDADKGDKKEATEGSEDEAYKIAYLTPSMDVPFWRYLADGIEKKVAEMSPNSTVEVYDSKDSADIQLKNAQDAIVKQVDAIIISPTDSSTAPAVLAIAAESDVPVIISDIGTDSGEYASFIITDNEAGAKAIGEFLAEKLKEGDQVAQITIPQARINGQLRKAGFESGIETNKLDQVDFRQMEKNNRQEGESFTQDLITAYPELKGIFVQAEDPTMGAITALVAAGREDVQVVGFDCSPEMLDAIREGTLLGTSAQQTVLMGKLSAEQAIKVLRGEEVEKEIKIGTMLITKDNIADVEEEIYDKVLTKDD